MKNKELLNAASAGNTKKVSYLLNNFSQNMDINARDSEGQTALFIACEHGNHEIAKLLLKHNANIEAATGWGATPLYIACEKGYLKIAKLLLDHNANIEAAQKNIGTTPLYIACQKGHPEVVKLLLDNDANIEAVTTWMDKTPLHIACQKGYLEIAKLLLDHNANIEARNKDGETPLHTAGYNDKPELVKLLLEHGANIEAETKSGETPLHTAGYNDKPELVKLLLEHGANIEAENEDGRTPLHHACYRGKPELVKLLLEHGANALAKNNSGRSCLDEAKVFERNDAIVNLLEAHLHLYPLGYKPRVESTTALSASNSVAELARLSQLENQLKELHGQHMELHAKSLLKLFNQEAVEAYRNSPNLWLFYRTVYIRLEEIFIGCKAVASDLIDTSQTSTLSTASTGITILGKVLSLIPAIGNSLDNLVAVASTSLSAIDKERQTNTLKAISALGTLADMKQAAENTARLLTDGYRKQIQALFTAEEEKQHIGTAQDTSIFGKIKKSAQDLKTAVIKNSDSTATEDLANFAVTQVLGALLDGSIRPNQQNSSLAQQFLAAVSSAPSRVETIKQTITNTLGFTEVQTRDGKVWQLQGIYRKPGIQTAEGTYYQGGQTEPAVYGYRLGTAAEAKALGLSQTTRPHDEPTPKKNTTPTTATSPLPQKVSIQQPSLPIKQAPTQIVGVVTKPDVDVLQKVEAMHLKHEQEINFLKQQQEAKEREWKIKEEAREIKEQERDAQIAALLKQAQRSPSVDHDNDVEVAGRTSAQLFLGKNTQSSSSDKKGHHPTVSFEEQVVVQQQIQNLGIEVAQIKDQIGIKQNKPESHADEESRALLGLRNPGKIAPKSSYFSAANATTPLLAADQSSVNSSHDKPKKRNFCGSCRLS